MHYLAKPGSLIHIVSDCAHLGAEHFALLGDLSRQCEVKVNCILDPFEQELPQTLTPQTLTVTDGQARSSLVLGDKPHAQRYRDQQQSRLAHLKDELSKVRVHPRLLSAGIALDLQMTANRRGFDLGIAL
jgi:hypothetical protein